MKFNYKIPMIIGLMLTISGILSAQQIKGPNEVNRDTIDYKSITLTMNDALYFALSHSNTVKIANIEVNKADYSRRQMWGKLFPKVDFTGSYGRTLKKQKIYFDLGNSSPMGGFGGNDGFEVGQTHNIQAGFQVGMPLVAPQLWQSLSIGAINVDLAKEKARSSRIDLVDEIKKAYVAILLARDAHAVFQKSYNNAQEAYKQIKMKYDKGLVAKFELIRQESQMKNLLPNVINSEQAITVAKAQLKVLMDMDINQPINIQGSLSDFENSIYDHYLLKEDSVNCDISNSPILRQLDIQKQLASKTVTSKKLAYIPNISLGYMYQYAFAANKLNLNNKRRWSPFSTISVQLSFPIFSGGNRYYEVKKAESDLSEVELNRMATFNKMKVGLMNEQKEIDNAAHRYVAAKDAVKTAEKGYEIAKVRYNSGGSSLLELNDAELQVMQAKLNYNQAIYDYLIATFDLDKMLGREVKQSQYN